MARPKLANPDLFLNRHFSWLQFNERVLEEAQDPRNPLLERVKFLAITASNLDEFVEGRTPREVLTELAARTHKFVGAQYDCWREDLVPSLFAERIRVVNARSLRPSARAHVENFYEKTAEPLLTPVTVDPAHPFPHVVNKAICLAYMLRRKKRGSQPSLGVVTVPRALPRLVQLPSPDGSVEYV